MSDDEDPEVVADRRLQAATIRQRGGKHEGASYRPPVIVAEWPCRACKKPYGVTEDAVEAYETWNRELARRGDVPLDSKAIVFCDSCRAVYTDTAPSRRRGQVERMRPVIQQLKRSNSPEQEYALLKQLDAWGHPDVPGLVGAIRARLEGKGKRSDTGKL